MSYFVKQYLMALFYAHSMPFCFYQTQFLPLLNLHPYFQFNTLWLVTLYYIDPLFLTRISFLIYTFFIYAHFSGTQIGYKTRHWCIVYRRSHTIHIII